MSKQIHHSNQLRYYSESLKKEPLFIENELEITRRYISTLSSGIHGICFSLYEENQRPGDDIDISQVERRMNILQPYVKWVRSFSCLEGNELIPEVAHKLGINTLVGAWLGKDKEKNELEIESLIELSRRGLVNMAAIGNEVLYRNDLSLSELLENIAYVKEALPDIPVGYVDAYYEFVNHPELIEACDVLLVNCYPFWEGTSQEDANQHMKWMYHQVREISEGKPIIISETGWPSHGDPFESAKPSQEFAMIYFILSQEWSKNENIPIFYFSSFDESWKINDEGLVGASWGLWDKHEKLKKL